MSQIESFKPLNDLADQADQNAPSFVQTKQDKFIDLALLDPTESLEWFSNKTLSRKAPYNTLAQMATLSTTAGAKAPRKTGIICTIGPKTNTPEKLAELRKAGMNIMRMNFSHGSYEYHGSVISNLKKSYEIYPGPAVAIALDTKGPEIRTGKMKNGDVQLTIGMVVTLQTSRDFYEQCDGENIFVDYPNIPKIVPVGGAIYIDDGLIRLEVISSSETTLTAKVMSNGTLSDNKGVNLPGSPVDLPSLSEKDIRDLQWGVEQGIDMVFASFIRDGAAIKSIREVFGVKGQRIQIIAKIENQQGLDNFDEILQQTDGVMVARGDLGIEIPVEKIFLAQKMMIAKCNIVGKPIICATQMLESMTFNPRPTRAEVSDVANAVLDGSDCVMLSGETAKGMYPNESVSTMAQICMEAEAAINHTQHYQHVVEIRPEVSPAAETLAAAAVNASNSRDVSAIVVFSISGRSARFVSKYRPHCPIICVTTDPVTARQSHLSRGIFPVLVDPDYTPESESWLQFSERKLLEAVLQCKQEGPRQLLKAGDNIIIMQGWAGGQGQANTMRLVKCPE